MIPYPDHIANSWLPVCAVDEIGTKPIRRLLHGVPLVIFRGRTGPAVLKDRCPHRNVPLSGGVIVNSEIRCPYHGWTFREDGSCSSVPGAASSERLCAEACPVHVEAGFVFTQLGRRPTAFPQLPYPLNDAAFDHGIWVQRYAGSLIDGMENFLDPTHPHFLHPRIVGRGAKRVPVNVDLGEHADRIEVTYHEEQRRRGWLPALLEGKRLQATAAFYPPTFCQIGFIGASGPQLFITVLFSPQTREDIQTLAVFSTPKGFLPAWFKRWALIRFHAKIIAQDQAMIRTQLENLKSFGAPKYTLGPADFMKPSMMKLMNGERLQPARSRMAFWL